MAVIKAVENVTLDGVMQNPESWAPPYQDEVLGQAMAQDMARPGALLFGRRTYEEFVRAWGGRDDNPFTPVLEARNKYVVSRTLSEPLPWQNSTLVSGDVAGLKRDRARGGAGGAGQRRALRSLLREGLVDGLLLTVFTRSRSGPARGLFEDAGPRTELELRESITTTTGVTIATYHRTGA